MSTISPTIHCRPSARRLAAAILLAVACDCLALSEIRAAEESLAVRRERIARMPADQREDLRRRLERFQALDPKEQARLRALHEEIERDPQSAELQQVVDRYHQWLVSLSPLRRAELADLKPDERIGRIKVYLDEQSQRDSKRLTAQDQAALMRWMGEVAKQREAQLLTTLPEAQKRKLNEYPPAKRSLVLFVTMWWRWQAAASTSKIPLGEQELADLLKVLSPEARQRLQSKPVPDQWHVVETWIRQVVRMQGMSGGNKPLLPIVNEEGMARFFESGMTDEQRDHLLSLSGDEMQRELRRMYMGSLVLGSSKSAEAGGRAKRSGAAEGNAVHSGKGKKSDPARMTPGIPRPEPDRKRQGAASRSGAGDAPSDD